MLTILKSLILALLNATLLLLALCLFLGWKMMGSATELAETVKSSLHIVAPLRGGLDGMSRDLADLRAELTELKDQGTTAVSERAEKALARVAQTQTRVDMSLTQIERLLEQPETILDSALTSAASASAEAINDLRGCTKDHAAAVSSSMVRLYPPSST